MHLSEAENTGGVRKGAWILAGVGDGVTALDNRRAEQ